MIFRKLWFVRVPFFMVIVGLFVLTSLSEVSASAVTDRLAGEDRYLTAIEVSQSGWPEGAENIVLATGLNYPDALSAAPLAGKYDAPVLLVGAKGLSTETLAEVKRLKPKKAYLIGGTGVIPSNVEGQLSVNGVSATRLAGADRYETAMAVARSVGMSKGIFVVPGQSFTDTLAAAPIAAAQSMPIIPVPAEELTKSQKSYFARAKLNRVIIMGSQKEISEQVRSYFPSAENISGADPYARNIALLEHFEETINHDKLFIATGQQYPDALAAAAYAKIGGNPVVLLNGSQIPSAAQDYFTKNVLNRIMVLGGESIIPSDTMDQLKDLLPAIRDVDNIRVTVLEKQKYDLPKLIEAETSNGNTVNVPVTWNLTTVSTSESGTYYYTGTVDGYKKTIKLELTVEAAPAKIDTLTAEVIQGGKYTLPETVVVTMSDYTTKKMPVTWSTTPTVSMLNKTGTYTFQGKIEGTSLTTRFSLKVSEDKAITFNDSRLEKEIKSLLGKKRSKQPLYLSEALEFTELDLADCNLDDLKGLEVFTNLETLELEDNNLESSALSVIQKLTNLKSLNLSENDLEQITSLKSLTKLEFLDISDNDITDFSPIKDLTRLTTLYLKSNDTQDYSPMRAYYHRLEHKDFFL